YILLNKWFFLDLKDLILPPIYLVFIYTTLLFLRWRLKDKVLKKYFIPAISLKIVGAIALGLIYEFFYGGGDTSVYWKYGTIIGDSFFDSPLIWLKLVFGSTGYDPDTYEYASQINWYSGDSSSYFVCRISGFFAPFSYNSYLVIAIFFAFVT